MDLDFLLGKDQSELSALQMTIRAVIIYLSAILMVRLGNKRFFGRITAFDFFTRERSGEISFIKK